MYPRDTRYILAGPAEYRAAHALLRQRGEEQPLSFPTVVALRDGNLLGVLGTTRSDEAIIAGPLAVSPEAPRPGIIVMRLVQAYDRVLRMAGVSSFLFYARTGNAPWRAILTKLGFHPYAAAMGAEWFTRRIA